MYVSLRTILWKYCLLENFVSNVNPKKFQPKLLFVFKTLYRFKSFPLSFWGFYDRGLIDFYLQIQKRML